MTLTEHLNEARLFKQKFKLEEAIEAFKKCLEIEPKNLIALSQAGFCSLILGRTQDAEMFFLKTFEETKKSDLPVASYLSAIFVANDKDGESKSVLEEIHQRDAQFSVAQTYMLVAEMLSEKKDFEKALRLIDKLCSDFKQDAFFTSPVNHYRVIRVLSLAGVVDIAETLANSLEEKTVDGWEGIAAQASVEIAKKEYEKAYMLTIKALQRGGSVNPLLAAQQHWLALNK